ncbi:hypothetical protein F5884DRAFT_309550 [Xylogone sp. PMI_703]|nr:hypothetical protein F5884DRAFT_309550 [Xylogone sp. PMI_703]
MPAKQLVPTWVAQVRQSRLQGLRTLEKQIDAHYQHTEFDQIDLTDFKISAVEYDPSTADDLTPALFFRPYYGRLPPPDDDKIGKPFPVYPSTRGNRNKMVDCDVINGYIDSYCSLCESLTIKGKSKKSVARYYKDAWEMLWYDITALIYHLLFIIYLNYNHMCVPAHMLILIYSPMPWAIRPYIDLEGSKILNWEAHFQLFDINI